MNWPALLPRVAVHQRLQMIFPEGTHNRNYLVRELSASTVFVALYVGAIHGIGGFIGPKHVYRMTDVQAAADDLASRAEYAQAINKAGHFAPGKPWYADTTREPIRDETLREGLVSIGAFIERTDLPTTSSRWLRHLGLAVVIRLRTGSACRSFRNSNPSAKLNGVA